MLIVGIDGFDTDVALRIGPRALPNLYPLVEAGGVHSGVIPPDSVPSWTSIITGQPPDVHGQLRNFNAFLGSGDQHARVSREDGCFWDQLPGQRVAVVNPFLAFPPWAPNGSGLMVSAPPFDECPPEVADPSGLLVGALPRRMGGFAGIPSQRNLEKFAEQTAGIARDQFEFSLRQLAAHRWDVFFHTSLTVDRMQHFAWRHFDETDPTYPGSALKHLIPESYRQVDDFIGEARSLGRAEDAVILVSDHGHGQRASIGVNLTELLRREGLLLIERPTRLRRAVERAKTATLAAASACHAEAGALWIARGLPGRAALKDGSLLKPMSTSTSVPDLAGSNPFGGIDVPDDATAETVVQLLSSLEFEGQRVVRWCFPAEEVVPGAASTNVYPSLLFEMEPKFGPTWNMFGQLFSPIITHQKQSGGHRRSGTFASSLTLQPPSDSADVNRALLEACL